MLCVCEAYVQHYARQVGYGATHARQANLFRMLQVALGGRLEARTLTLTAAIHSPGNLNSSILWSQTQLVILGVVYCVVVKVVK